MIAFPSSVRVWLAVGRTDMRRGMQGLSGSGSHGPTLMRVTSTYSGALEAI